MAATRTPEAETPAAANKTVPAPADSAPAVRIDEEGPDWPSIVLARAEGLAYLSKDGAFISDIPARDLTGPEVDYHIKTRERLLSVLETQIYGRLAAAQPPEASNG